MTRVITAKHESSACGMARGRLLADGRGGRTAGEVVCLRMAGVVVCLRMAGVVVCLRMAGEVVCLRMAGGRPRMAGVVRGWRLAVPDGQRREVGAIGVSAGRGQTPWSAARPRSGGSSVFLRTTHDVGHHVRRRGRWAGARACTNALFVIHPVCTTNTTNTTNTTPHHQHHQHHTTNTNMFFLLLLFVLLCFLVLLLLLSLLFVLLLLLLCATFAAALLLLLLLLFGLPTVEPPSSSRF